jgi:hypothetical protein
MAKKLSIGAVIGILGIVILSIFLGGFSMRGPAASLPRAAPTQGVPASAANESAQGNQDGVLKYAAPEDRLVIKNATLQVVVTNPQESLAGISKMAEDMGGWVVASSTRQATSRAGTIVTQASLTLRIPAERLTDALQQIKNSAESIQTENVTGQDVTQEYTDLQSLLVNLEAAETQLRKIMETAGKTDDVLAVYRELVRVRGEIEVTRGRMAYFKQAAAFSSIQLTLIPSTLDKPLEIAGWQPLVTAKNALEALVTALQGVVNMLIWLAVLVLPLIVLFGIPALLLARFVQRRAARPTTPIGASVS